MERAASSKKAQDPRSQPAEASKSSLRGASHPRYPDKEHAKGQRKQRNGTRRTQEPQDARIMDSEQPSRKRRKNANDPNDSRRQRNLKNLMMLNRLEANIGRMEARLQGLGLDFEFEGTAQAPSQPLAPKSPQIQPSPGVFGYEERLVEGPSHTEQYVENNHVNLEAPGFAELGGVDQEHDEPNPRGKREYPFLGELEGLLLPRCILDTPTSGGLPALSEEGAEWMSRKSGVTPKLFGGHQSNAMPFPSSDNDFPRKVYCPLPAKEEASSLLYEYLQNFNNLCPLFEQNKLVSLFDQENLNTAHLTPACWASINVVLALGIAFRIKNGSVAQSEHQKSWLFIKNAFGIFHDLCLGPPDMWSIQALLGMAVFFLGTMSAEPCCFLTTAAIRMSHHIGLEKMEGECALSSEAIEHRKNIFWISYCLDREICLRFEKAPAQSDENMSRVLPTESPMASARIMPSMYRHGNFDTFKAHCQLATIKGQLYKDLYSAAARTRSLSDIMTSVGTLDEMLQSWRDDLPPEYQPESQGFNIPPSSISVTLLYLHCSYFNCIIAMHRLIASRGIRMAKDLLEGYGNLDFSDAHPYAPRAFASESLCANAARASIRLMKYMPEGHMSLVGILIHYPIVALTTLSLKIVRNPLDASRLTDMKLMDQVETFLSSLVVSIPNQVLSQLRVYCANYRAAANAAIQKTMQFCGT